MTEEELIEAERRAEGEEFFKLAQKEVSVRAEEACAQREQQIECLVEELRAAQGYAEGLRSLLAAEGQGDEVAQWGWMVEGEIEEEARETMVEGAVMCRELMEECEGALEQVQGLEQTVDELIGDEDRLVEEVCALQHKIQELEVRTSFLMYQSVVACDIALSCVSVPEPITIRSSFSSTRILAA